MYLQSKIGETNNTPSLLFYLLCILYILSVATLAGDITDFIFTVSHHSIRNTTLFFFLQSVVQFLDTSRPNTNSLLIHLAFLQITVTGLCDFLAQIILVRIAKLLQNLPNRFYSFKYSQKIYRCWVVWSCNTRVVIIPSFLSIAFLGEFNPLRSFLIH
jgi:hypothetical protein